MSPVPLLLIVASLFSGSILTGPLLFTAAVLTPATILIVLWILMRFLFSTESAA